MQPSIDVIIPFYNSKKYILEAIKSVYNQDYKNINIIAVDDGSTDNTIDIINKTYKNVNIIKQSNQGPAIARNNGILSSNGEYLSFLDSDDLWSKNKIEIQMKFLNNNTDIKMVSGLVEEFHDKDVITRNYNKEKAYTIGSILIKRDDFFRVGLFNNFLFGEFIDWISRYKSLGLKEYVINETVLYRRLHDKNTTLIAKDKKDYLKVVIEHMKRKQNEKNRNL